MSPSLPTGDRALASRERIVDVPFYRLVHAEADGLPGLIIDRYGAAIALQANTAGMEGLTPLLLEALDAVVSPGAVLLRNDSPVRGLEGLQQNVEWAKAGINGSVELLENGARFPIELGQGQKTGWFFDQRENRAMVASFAQGARMLDLYSYGGGFAVQAACGGATEVLAIDRSESALAAAALAAGGQWRRGALPLSSGRGLCGVAAPERCAQAVRYCRRRPAGFRQIEEGAGARRQGLSQAGAACGTPSELRRIPVRRFVLASRRSAALCRAGSARAIDANRSGRIFASTGAAKDHPVHPALPESAYLKGQFLQLD